MSIACPYCKAVLNPPKGMKPGKYTPKCPKCAKQFVLLVPDDPGGTISIQQLTAQKKPPTEGSSAGKTPAAKPGSGAVKNPTAKTGTNKASAASPRPAARIPSPDPDTDHSPGKRSGTVKPPEPRPPARKPPSAEDAAAALLDGRDADDSDDATEEMSVDDPNATGNFSEPEPPPKPAPKLASTPTPRPAARKAQTDDAPPKGKPSPKVDPNATGDFTENDESEPPKPAPKKAVAGHPPASPKSKPAPKVDPNATGDFTEHDEPALGAGEATGDFTENDGTEEDDSLPATPRKPAVATDPSATGDFTENEAADEEPRPAALKPAKKVKAKAEPEAGVDDDDVPPRLGGYEVLKVLGKGGMGAVLLGRQISLDRKVALKVMHPKIAKNPGFVARFTREAYAAAQITHHNVIQIYDIGEDRGQHFFSMEFVQGQSLMELVKKEGKLTPRAAVGYVLQAARGLRYGHNQGMVHRDIKPDNLMINSEGIVKVADLGLVKLPSGELPEQAGALPAGEDGEEGDSNLTRAGAVMGTPAYMSPEQSKDSAGVDARADIYSLGCSLYVLVTGKPPFEGKTALEIISKHQTEPITPPEVVVKRVPKALSTIILKMTAKKPAERYQSMDEVIAALEGFLGLEKTETFNPKEEQADQLEKCCHQFNYRSKGGRKRSLALAFFAACAAGIVGGAFSGLAALAGGLLGLMLMTPIAYFIVHGIFTGSVVFTKTREVVFGMRFFDWVMWIGGGFLFLATLFLFGLLFSWIVAAAVAAGLAFALWFITDRVEEAAQEQPLEEARTLFKTLRLSGLDEEQLRQFVCKFSGSNWEPFYEALFGYEAKLAARTYRKGDTGEVSKKAGTWREPVMGWLDARLEARRLAKERRYLQKVEAKALEAEGVSAKDAKAQAEAMAADLVDHAAEAKAARKEGKTVSVKKMVAAAKERRRPKPGYNLAGKPLKSLWLKDFLNDWFGRRLRFLLGAVVFAAGLLWLHQNNLLKDNKAFSALTAGDFAGAQQAIGKPTKPLDLPGGTDVPEELKPILNSWNLPITGLLLMLNGALYAGWRPTIVTVPGAALALFGVLLPIPPVDPLAPSNLNLIVGAVLIVVVARFLRQ